MQPITNHGDPGLDFRRLFDAAPGLYLVLNPDLTIAAVNNAYARATMIEPQAVIGRNIFDVFPDNPDNPSSDGAGNLRASLERVLQTRRPDAMAIQKYDVRKPDGTFEERYWSPLNAPVLGEDGNLCWIIHRVEDVTDLVRHPSNMGAHDQIRRDQQLVIEELRAANLKLAQTLSDNALLEREHVYLASIVESSSNAIIGKTLDGTVTSWNSAAEVLFGYRPAEIIGQPITLLIPPDLLQEETKIIDRVGRGELVVHYETARMRKDGKRLEVSLTLSPIRDKDSNVVGASAIVRDISAEKEAEIELRNLQAERLFLADLVACSNDAIVARAIDGKIRSWNRAAELMFGYSAAEMIGQAATLPPDLEAEARVVFERLNRGEPIVQYETRRPHKDGHQVHVSFTASLIRNQEGKIVGSSGILRDITERKRTEAKTNALQDELAHVSRLSAMGQVSAAIAHELNQPLSAITNYIASADRMMGDEPAPSTRLQKAREAIEKARQQTFRAAAIIRSLRDFVEKRESTRAPQTLSVLVREAVELGMLGHRYNHVALRIDLEDSTVTVNKVQMQQVLVNLVRNALEAMARTEKPELAVSSVADTTGTTITIRDNGPGFPPEIFDQLFQPFVTTKETGMGIGLRVCRSIVEAHGGSIRAENANPGAVFVIHLPRQPLDEAAE